MEIESIDLLDLLSQVNEGVGDLFPEKIWVKAEIASIQQKSNGHCYLELCQSDGRSVVAKVKAMIWKNRYFAVASYFRDVTGGDMTAGISILARVQVNFSELYGLGLVVDEVEPMFTLGEAELKKRQTIARLTEEGLMDVQKGLELPALPYRLAVISASDAAGFGDFKRHLTENEYGFVFDIRLFEALMQGSGSPSSITEALEAVSSSETAYDAILILRGGGSVLDLACFDDYGLCSAIAHCPIPVYTAIGHDRDYHVADMVACSFVKTPTALADEFIDAFAAEDEHISSYSDRLRYAFARKISEIESRLEILGARIHNADPRNILSRGYTLVAGENGVVVKSSKLLNSGDYIEIFFPDGAVKAKIL